MEHDMKFEFKRGDIIARISKELRWVVTGWFKGRYIDGENWYSYNIKPLGPDGLENENSWDKAFTERDCIKVGTWDFDNGREVSDDEI